MGYTVIHTAVEVNFVLMHNMIKGEHVVGKKKRGPRMDPRGTPQERGLSKHQEEKDLPA